MIADPLKSRRTVKCAWRMQAPIKIYKLTTVDEVVKHTKKYAQVSGVKVGSSQHRLAAEIALTTSGRDLDMLMMRDLTGDWDPE